MNYRKYTIILKILLDQRGLFLIKGLLLAPSSTNYLLKWMPRLSILFAFVRFIQGWEVNVRKQEKILCLKVCQKR